MIYKPTSWNLQELKPKDLDSQLNLIRRKVSSFEKRRSLLSNKVSPALLLSFLKELEDIHHLSSSLSTYAYLKFSENTADQNSLAQMSKVENFLTKESNRLIFFGLWFKSLPDQEAEKLIGSSGKYHYYLKKIRLRKRYTLQENEEKIINLKDSTGSSALNNLYNLHTSNFTFCFNRKTISQEELINFVRSPSPKIREQAYVTLLARYKENKNLLGEIYRNLVYDWYEENVSLRSYPSPLSVRNISNDLPDRAVSALLNTCRKNQPLFHKYFLLKQKKLRLKSMRRYDLYAPLAHEKNDYSYDFAVKKVLNTFQQFSPEFHRRANEIIQQQHIHSLLQKNKQSGAYCSTPSVKTAPFVFLNYTGTIRDISTLAHELGHGIHSLLAKNNTEFTQHACLPLAETASIFSEMLLSEQLLQEDPKRSEDIIFLKMDNLYASIIRQAGFVEFEIKAHQLLREGKTIDDISRIYLKDLKDQLGPHIKVDDNFAYEWCLIPHIYHTPFYCYAYAFGNLLSLALYNIYREKGSRFTPLLIEFLSKGGSESPVDLLNRLGIDPCSESFWQNGFDHIENMIKKVE